ncbi:hypothetical protein DVH05_014384 [Phytophthora capsici]|nr:hypothetical protein DVH05_014384 [Phytophthora capsici]
MQQPPPPPPLPGALSGPPPPMPPQLQAMMRQMQQRQPKFQTQHQQNGRGGRNGRGRGRGRGRGGFQQNHRQNRGGNKHQSQFKRKRGPSDDMPDASRFFMPSFLEDPWKQLENNGQDNASHEHGEKKQNGRQREEMRPQQVHYPTKDGPGRVFFQPSFLEDPWASLVH